MAKLEQRRYKGIKIKALQVYACRAFPVGIYMFLPGKGFNKGDCSLGHACTIMTNAGNRDKLPVEWQAQTGGFLLCLVIEVTSAFQAILPLGVGLRCFTQNFGTDSIFLA